MLGDANEDGKVDAKDASTVLVLYALYSTGGDPSLTPEQFAADDVNGDGQINSKDASLILAYYTYLSTGGALEIKDFLAQ